jgi:hypothetical protein
MNEEREKCKMKNVNLKPPHFRFAGFVKSLLGRHPGESRGPEHLESRSERDWIPAFAGMTNSIEAQG